jgi:hypothetical protein
MITHGDTRAIIVAILLWIALVAYWRGPLTWMSLLILAVFVFVFDWVICVAIVKWRTQS